MHLVSLANITNIVWSIGVFQYKDTIIGILMIKERWSHNCLNFMMGIYMPEKVFFLRYISTIIRKKINIDSNAQLPSRACMLNNNKFTWVSWQLSCLFNRLLRLITKKTPKLHFTGSLWEESTGDQWFPHKGPSNMVNVSMSWNHYVTWIQQMTVSVHSCCAVSHHQPCNSVQLWPTPITLAIHFRRQAPSVPQAPLSSLTFLSHIPAIHSVSPTTTPPHSALIISCSCYGNNWSSSSSRRRWRWRRSICWRTSWLQRLQHGPRHRWVLNTQSVMRFCSLIGHFDSHNQVNKGYSESSIAKETW